MGQLHGTEEQRRVLFPLASELVVGALVRLLGCQVREKWSFSSPRACFSLFDCPYLAPAVLGGGRGSHSPCGLHRTAGQQHSTT